MTMVYLKSLFTEGGNVVEFRGKCHDCGAETAVVCTREGEEVYVSGGAYWREIGRDFVKCETCFGKLPKLTNYMPCEVYSRVVGYLRPVQQWNTGKKAEFKDRKMFKVSGS